MQQLLALLFLPLRNKNFTESLWRNSRKTRTVREIESSSSDNWFETYVLAAVHDDDDRSSICVFLGRVFSINIFQLVCAWLHFPWNLLSGWVTWIVGTCYYSILWKRWTNTTGATEHWMLRDRFREIFCHWIFLFSSEKLFSIENYRQRWVPSVHTTVNRACLLLTAKEKRREKLIRFTPGSRLIFLLTNSNQINAEHRCSVIERCIMVAIYTLPRSPIILIRESMPTLRMT